MHKSLALALGGLLFFNLSARAAGPGVLVLAHGVAAHHDDGHEGHEGEWEQAVRQVVTQVSDRLAEPVELAFGMWSRKNFQAGIDRLAARGVDEVRIVPLFISSHSEVIRAQAYQFHLSESNPLPFDPGRVTIPASIRSVTMSGALDDSPELSAILADRASELSENPAREEFILVAHGPLTDADDALWLADLSTHASRLGIDSPVRVITVRDDADEEVRDEMTRRLRRMVTDAAAAGRVAVIVPVLLASGGIERGILERLQGLSYRYNGRMVGPDSRLADWVTRVARE